MTTYNFDEIINRRDSDCEKWRAYDADVIPLWVADMDFRAPQPVVEALQQRVAHGIFGYPHDAPELIETLAGRLHDLYGWRVEPEAFVLLPGVIPGFNLACHALAQPGDAAVVFPPVYSPILDAPRNAGLARVDAPLRRRADLRYELDFDALESALADGARLVMLCSPHNPVGRVFRADELAQLAEICLRHDAAICSDEIHGDLIFSGCRHTPIAALSPEVSARTITLMAPSKTYNIPGLKFAFAVIPDRTLRERFNAARAGLVSEPNVLGQVAACAAYADGGDWLHQCLAYLEGNRDFITRFMSERLPGVAVVPAEGTYLAWLDCTALDLPRGPYRFFLDEARVALGNGAGFGPGGEGFVRLNFACSRALLSKALDRMAAAVGRWQVADSKWQMADSR
jgi:cystathionine beta-lyase